MTVVKRKRPKSSAIIPNDAKGPAVKQKILSCLLNKHTLLLAALLGFSLGLNLIETEWGLSGFSTWQTDTIEGERTVGHMQLLFKTWKHKYPRGHFLVNAIFYYPVLKHWQKNPVVGVDQAGQKQAAVLNAERLCILAKIARWIVVFMNLGTILAVFLLTKYLSGDYLSALFAGLALSVSYLFVFYSSLGHIDVPFVFWFSWTCYFAVRAVYEHKWHQYILAGLLAAYTVCTKEGYAGYIPGLAAVYCILRSHKVYQETKSLKPVLLSICSVKVLTAAVLFAGLCLIMSGFLAGPDEFLGRLKTWQEDPHFHVNRSQISLLTTVYKQLHVSLGWPLLVCLAGGIGYAVIRKKRLLVFGLLPLIVFYLVTVVRIRFVEDRFMLPAFVGFAALIGTAAADWSRWKKVPAILRWTPLIALFGLTTFYCVGLKLDMKHDARVQAEKWFHQNVGKDKIVGTAIGYGNALRIGHQGYRQILLWTSKGVQTPQGLTPFFPDYLVMSPTLIPDQCRDDGEFRKKLYEGQTEYKQVAGFRSLYFGRPSVYSIAVWPYRPIWFVSIPVDIFEKQKNG